MNIDIACDMIKKSKSIAIFCHTNPDGDTLGSAAALLLALKTMGMKCSACCDGKTPEKYVKIPGIDAFTTLPEGEFDLLIALDCAELSRLGENERYFVRHSNTINIDHHHTNSKFAKLNIVDNTSSTAEIVLSLIEKLKLSVSKDIATGLFVGITTDTGSFQHGNTDHRTFLAAARLAEAGIDIADIGFTYFKNMSLERTKILGKVLSRVRMYLDNRVAVLYILKSDFDEFNVNKLSTEGFIDYAIGITGTEVGVSICQQDQNVYKVSFRGKENVDVSKIARDFGGGGHKPAAGCIVSGLFEDVIEKIVRQISFYL